VEECKMYEMLRAMNVYTSDDAIKEMEKGRTKGYELLPTDPTKLKTPQDDYTKSPK
jgi:hypothetical protein